jgi:hypothetical protein
VHQPSQERRRNGGHLGENALPSSHTFFHCELWFLTHDYTNVYNDIVDWNISYRGYLIICDVARGNQIVTCG